MAVHDQEVVEQGVPSRFPTPNDGKSNLKEAAVVVAVVVVVR